MNDAVNEKQGYVPFDIKDSYYAGAGEVIKQEFKLLAEKRENFDKDKLKGVALSGGGIRSASFCLGVMQVLARENKLKKFEYLSTVSGGGYIGGSLSWMWSGIWRQNRPRATEQACTREFGTGQSDFPFGCGERNSSAPDQDMNRDQASLMRYLRQHGEYLVPGKGISFLSFLSVVLRSVTMGLVTLLVLASWFFHVLHMTPVFNEFFTGVSYMLFAGCAVFVAYLFCLLCYGVLVMLARGNHAQSYNFRRRWEIFIKWPLIISLFLLFIGATDSLRALIEARALEVGGVAAFAGSMIAWFSQRAKVSSILKFVPRVAVIYAGVTLMFLGLFMLSDQIAFMIVSSSETDAGNADMKLLAMHTLVVAFILVMAWLVPINKVSIHRYYRDRLMETFMPDVCDILHQGDSFVATAANETGVHALKDTLSGDIPYHIINTNIVLVESGIAKFRGRGGDNFILSPCYSGSNATGWRRTEVFAGGSITLPTAVAISGAAANPDAGVAGKGITINPLVSTLMSIFNLRLGYWCVNPDWRIQPDQHANPNYLIPGFWGSLGRSEINETSPYVQLSDGGHFENLAMYELLRRRCKLIICCDGEQDSDFAFESLANVIEKVRVDLGITIDIDADDLVDLKYSVNEQGEIKYAKSGYLVSDIKYPDGDGQLVYIKTTLPHELPGDVVGYRSKHPDFPDETTADQFFDETQMEAYRMLGKHIASAVVKDTSINW
jgi:hypothetical protein